MKDKSNYELFKVPDSAIVKSQAIEIGMLKGEIQELKDLNKTLSKETKAALKSRKKILKHAERLEQVCRDLNFKLRYEKL